jgi:hypothetical protein
MERLEMQFTFWDAEASEGVQLAKLASCSTLTGILKSEIGHARFNETWADRVHSNVSLLKLIR